MTRSKKKQKKTTKRSKTQKQSTIIQEINGILFAAVLVYALASLYGLQTGKVGLWLAGVCLYLFGSGAKLLLCLLFLEAARIFRGQKRRIAGRQLGLTLLTLVFLTSLHLQTQVLDPWLVIPVSWQSVSASVGMDHGGGIIGAIVTFVFLRFFDVIGTYVVLITLGLVGLLLFLDKPMRRFIGKIFSFFGQILGRVFSGVAYLFKLLGLGLGKIFAPLFLLEEKEPVVSTESRKKPEVAVTAETSDTSEISISAYQGPTPTGDKSDFEWARLAKDSQYQLPSLDLLAPPEKTGAATAKTELVQMGRLLEQTLANFGIEAKVTHIDCGPVITRYELQPAPGIKVSRIVNLADDLALALAAEDIRIEAPIPGKAAVGIEVPNKKQELVKVSEVVATPEFHEPRLKLPLALGKGVAGDTQVVDLSGMPHLLIAGATGSGKSVCINTIIISLLYRLRPDQLRILMVDPKRVELALYDGIPHLLAPVITDPKKAATALKWVVEEMETRYQLFADAGVRNIEKYNEYVNQIQPKPDQEPLELLPYVVVIIDELADLMMVASSEVEDAICRLAQMARAAGIHLIVATQRPSVDVITGLIKANIPARIGFAVSSQVDSRTILDAAGAERLIGKGDMLYLSPTSSKTVRIQGAYISDKEIEAVTKFWKNQGQPEYQEIESTSLLQSQSNVDSDDELYPEAVRLVINSGQASISLLQRRFRIGHSRAARLMDTMELRGIVGPYQGSKPREVLVSASDNDEF